VRRDEDLVLKRWKSVLRSELEVVDGLLAEAEDKLRDKLRVER
jgi:hypothetical protein